MSENNENISVSHPVALLSCALLHIITGARSAQGAANRRRPLHPGLWRTKSPLRGALDLSLAATGSGAR